ncbi:response regulator [candidate division KSB1 bacterium]|nr:response regulator [candidate division KSB1 bacterium]
MQIEKAKILVVDDELGMREGIQRLLEIQGHQVDTAETGRQGIDLGTETEYDLYLLDLKIGDIDGTEVLRNIKLVYPEAICVIITAYASIDTAVETTRLGAYHYIAKPFSPEELQHLVQRALERRWYVLEARRLKKEQERRLLEVANEKSRIRTIINTIDDGILVVNQDRQVVLFNPRFMQLLQIQQEIQIGDSVLQVLPETLHEQFEQVLQQKNSVKAIQQEIVIEPPAKLVVMVNTTPILDSKDRMLGVVSVFRDVSGLKQLDLLKSQFINMAAHELKAPLSAIKGYIELVTERTLGESLDDYDNYLDRSLERLNSLINLINDLLNISRMESGKIRREIHQVDVSELLNKTLEFFKTEAEKRDLTVESDFSSGLMIEADPEEIQRVFNNLISNAIKYNKPQGKLSVSAEKHGHYVAIEVSDTGIGLKPEEKERLFEEFFRAKNPLTRNVTGTGLGLTIIKKIIDNYAGKITVDSEFEKGSTFTVHLPVKQTEEND